MASAMSGTVMQRAPDPREVVNKASARAALNELIDEAFQSPEEPWLSIGEHLTLLSFALDEVNPRRFTRAVEDQVLQDLNACRRSIELHPDGYHALDILQNSCAARTLAALELLG